MSREQNIIKNALMFALLLMATATHAQPLPEPEHSIEVPVNKSRVVNLDFSPKKVSVGNEAVADILMMRARQLYVVGKAVGSTNVVLWDQQDRIVESIDVQVTYDVDRLKAQLHNLLPGEPIAVHASNGAIVLSGEVSSAPKMDMALQLARSTARSRDEKAEDAEGRVLNMMQIGGAQQVLLEVKVAEIARTFIKQLGVKFHAITTDGNLSIGAVNGPGHVMTMPFGGAGAEIPSDSTLFPGIPSTLIAPGSWVTNDLADPRVLTMENHSLVASFLDGTTLSNVVIDAAKEEGLAKVLAEPTLTTLTGEPASFLAGGEFPVPVPGDDQTVTIDYKDFGVSIDFVPTVLDSGQVSLAVDIAVSELTNENAVTLNVPGVSSAFFVPSLSKRRASSTVELASGQTIGIAGLINENLRERVNKFPGLGDIPLLGALFRSQEFIKGQTELVIFVTPRFARAFDPKLVSLPTDSFVEPSDAEFYLLGRVQGRSDTKKQESVVKPADGGVEGRFGHDL